MIPLRPILAAAIVVAILGTIYGYTRFLNHLHARAQDEAAARERELIAAAEGEFEVEITPTFASEVDAFSAELDPKTGEPTAASLIVRLAGKDGAVLLRRTDPVPAGQPIRIAAPGVRVGANVFYVETSPRLADAGNATALHVRIYRNLTLITEKTLWANAGERLGGSLEIDVPAAPGAKLREH